MAIVQVVVAAGRFPGAIATSTRQDLLFGNTRSLLEFPRPLQGPRALKTRPVVVRLSKEHLGAQEFGKLTNSVCTGMSVLACIGRNDIGLGIWEGSSEFEISASGNSVGWGTQKLCTCILAGERKPGDFGLERRAFLRNCVASWLLVCTAAMAETAGAQPSATNSDGAQATVIFYNYALAFNPAKARLALEEKNIKYVEKKVDIFNGQSLEPWYLKLNPSASVPTLVVGTEAIPESADIVRWADRQGAGPLGGDSIDKSFVSAWLSKVDAWDGNLFAAANTGAAGVFKTATTFKIKIAEANADRYPDLAELYNKKAVALQKTITEPTDAAICEANRKQLVELLDEAESRLAGNQFLAGPEYSAADVIFTPVLYRVYKFNKDKEYLENRTNVKRYYEELKKRPSFQKVFGVSESAISSAQQILPAVGKILFSKVTGKF